MIEFTVRPELYTEIREWCKMNLGAEGAFSWSLLANNEIGGHIYINEEIDAIAFKLRWAE